MIRNTIFCTVVCLLCLTLGCGDGGSGAAILKRRSNLETLGAAYLAYHEANGKSAANATDLAGFMAQSATDPKTSDAITSLTEGDIRMIFNAELGESAENARRVLGFEAGVPATGGYVVMGDGTVRLMTVKDYSEASLVAVSNETQ
jgi:hypothetical protein